MFNTKRDTGFIEPVFVGTDGRRCGEDLPSIGDRLTFDAGDPATVEYIRYIIDKKKAADKPAFWVDFL